MKKVYNVNWIDGMKINKSHFEHNDRRLRYAAMNIVQALSKSYEYGILPTSQASQKPLIQLEDGIIVLNYCYALTRAGDLVHIEKENNLKFDLKDITPEMASNEKLLVLISMDHENQVAFGVPDPKEMPPHQPFSHAKYYFTVIPYDRIHTAEFAYTFTIVGQLIKNYDNYIIDDNYIFPCFKILSSTNLLEHYLKIENVLSEIADNATRVVQNARSKKRRGEINDLAENTFYLMERVLYFLAENMHKIRTIYKEESPIYLFTFLNSFARVIMTALNCIKSVDREALLRYYESHLGLQPHQFESDIKSLSQIEYDNMNLNINFNEADKYLETLRSFVSKAINLEYHSVERVDVLNEKVVKKNKLDIF